MLDNYGQDSGPVRTRPRPGDVDRDGAVDSDDLMAVNDAMGDGLLPGSLSLPFVDNIIGWDGYVFNGEIDGGGVYTVRYRCYRPELGRWLERDPIGYLDGLNLYQYVASNSTKHIDPFGWARYIKRCNRPVPTSPVPIPTPPISTPCSKKCPQGMEITVIIIGDIKLPWYKGMLGEAMWEGVCNDYIRDARNAGENVIVYENPTTNEVQEILEDPCLENLIIIGHGYVDDDGYGPGIWLGGGSSDVLYPQDVRTVLRNCQGPDRVLIRACGQGNSGIKEDWEDCFNLPDDRVFAPRDMDLPWDWWLDYNDCFIVPQPPPNPNRLSCPSPTPNVNCPRE